MFQGKEAQYIIKMILWMSFQIYSRVGSGGRPIVNSSAPLIVRFGLAVMQMGLDERDNMMSTSVWCRYVCTLLLGRQGGGGGGVELDEVVVVHNCVK